MLKISERAEEDLRHVEIGTFVTSFSRATRNPELQPGSRGAVAGSIALLSPKHGVPGGRESFDATASAGQADPADEICKTRIVAQGIELTDPSTITSTRSVRAI